MAVGASWGAACTEEAAPLAHYPGAGELKPQPAVGPIAANRHDPLPLVIYRDGVEVRRLTAADLGASAMADDAAAAPGGGGGGNRGGGGGGRGGGKGQGTAQRSPGHELFSFLRTLGQPLANEQLIAVSDTGDELTVTRFPDARWMLKASPRGHIQLHANAPPSKEGGAEGHGGVRTPRRAVIERLVALRIGAAPQPSAAR